MLRLPTVLVLVGVLLTGCTAAEGPATFVAEASDQLSIVQWTEDGDGVLTGTYQVVSASSKSDGPATESSDASIRGRVSKGALNLTVDGLTTITGTLSGDTLTLSVPQKDGGVRTVTYSRSTIESYNRAVQALATRVSTEREEQAKAAADASAAAALAGDEQALADSIGNIPELISAVKTAGGGLTVALGNVQSALKTQRAALAAVKSADCVDVFTRIGDEGTAYGDLMTAEGDFGTATADLASAEQDLQTQITSIQASAKSVQAQGGTVPDLSSVKEAAGVLRQSGTTKTTATAKVHSLTTSAEQIDTAANDLASRAC
ncbi:hypothetical protein [Kribbella sp. NPDC051620]|uniref:hypothetical protein n=1 Tax=Kribbella sp. NPDC051620 TaxID=3364120 RepID=UPI00379C0843